MKGLAIKDVAERTGLAPGTIRMWEQRYGLPVPGRAESGYRVYTADDVELLRRAVSLRERGWSVPAALDRARTLIDATDRPSIYGAIASADVPVKPQVLRKRTLIAISHAIEDETIARAAGPVVFGAFQHERNYRHEEHRYRRMAERADAAVVFADFPLPRLDAAPAEIPIPPDAALGNEWAVIVDAPGLRRLRARVGASADAGGGARAARARPALRVALDDGSGDRAAGGARRLRTDARRGA